VLLYLYDSPMLVIALSDISLYKFLPSIANRRECSVMQLRCSFSIFRRLSRGESGINSYLAVFRVDASQSPPLTGSRTPGSDEQHLLRTGIPGLRLQVKWSV
jgi:hypothetical protein